MVKYINSFSVKLTGTIFNIIVWFAVYLYFKDVSLYITIDGVSIPENFLQQTLVGGLVFNAVLFYGLSIQSISKFLFHKTLKYIVFAIFMYVIVSICETIFDWQVIDWHHHKTQEEVLLFLLKLNLKLNSLVVVLAIVVASLRNGLITWQLKQEIEKKHLQTELILLKSQIHPHFLFNVLNTLFSSAHNNGDEKTAHGIGQLSHLLRYMLYETKEKFVIIEQEIEYLRSFIELMEMRFEQNVKLNLYFDERLKDQKIAPMILITLVENAFKYGISPNKQSEILISLVENNSKILFTVENTIAIRNQQNSKHSGIGLNNLRKRLEALYPNRHNLTIYSTDTKYKAELELL